MSEATNRVRDFLSAYNGMSGQSEEIKTLFVQAKGAVQFSDGVTHALTVADLQSMLKQIDELKKCLAASRTFSCIHAKRVEELERKAAISNMEAG